MSLFPIGRRDVFVSNDARRRRVAASRCRRLKSRRTDTINYACVSTAREVFVSSRAAAGRGQSSNAVHRARVSFPLHVRAVGRRPADGYVRRLGHQRFDHAQLLHVGPLLLLALLPRRRVLLAGLHERLVSRGRVVVRAPLARHPRVVAHLDRLVDDQQR